MPLDLGAVDFNLFDVKEGCVEHDPLYALGRRLSLEGDDGMAVEDLLLPVDSPFEMGVGDLDLLVVALGCLVKVLGV